jgi:hypothetical protein
MTGPAGRQMLNAGLPAAGLRAMAVQTYSYLPIIDGQRLSGARVPPPHHFFTSRSVDEARLAQQEEVWG